MKKLLIFCCLFFVFACGARHDSKDLVVLLTGEIESLDPAFSYDGITHGVLLNIYDTLIKFKGGSLTEFEPLIAETVPSLENGLISPDGLTYIFPIRQGIKFHNGAPLTAEDVAYSLQRFLITDAAGGPSSLLLEPILGLPSTRGAEGKIIVSFEEIARAASVQGNNVIIKLKKPFAPFLGIMARWSYIINKDWAIANGEWDGTAANWQAFNNRPKTASYLFDHENGSGPFAIARWDIAAKRVYLKANKNYFLGAPKLDSVIFLTIPEQSTMRLMLEAGDADFAEIATSFTALLEGNPKIKIHDTLPRLKTDPVIFFTFDINSQANPDIGSGKLDGQGIPPDFFKDENIRKAFSYSFDYDAFARDTMRGKAQRAKGAVPPGLIGYNKNAPAYNLDLRKAEEYFKKAMGGKVWQNGFYLVLTYNAGGKTSQAAGEIIKRNIESINPKFKIELRGVPWPSLLEKTQNRKMPLWIRGWIADYPDAHNFVFPFLHSKGRYAIAQGFADPQLDALIDRAVRATSIDEREKIYQDIHNIAYNRAVQIYTVHSPGVWVHTNKVKGFSDNPVFMGLYLYPVYKE